MIVRDEIFDFGIGTGIGVRCFDLENACAKWDVLVDVVRLVVGKLKFGSVVVDVGNANRELIKKLNINYFRLENIMLFDFTSTDVENPPESSVAVTTSE